MRELQSSGLTAVFCLTWFQRWIPAGYGFEEDDDVCKVTSAAADLSCQNFSSNPPCSNYWAPSLQEEDQDRWIVYSGISRSRGEMLDLQDPFFSMIDANTNEYSPWHDLAWPAHTFLPEALLENYNLHPILVPGIASLLANGEECSPDESIMYNLEWKTIPKTDRKNDTEASKVHRFSDPTVGSFSDQSNARRHLVVTKDIVPGEVLRIKCTAGNYNSKISQRQPHDTQTNIAPLHALIENDAICLDAITVQASTIPKIGQGAFAKRATAAGETIVQSPALLLDRSQLEIVHQHRPVDEKQHSVLPKPLRRSHGIEYTSDTWGHQLLRNYVYGRPDSNVMLWPLAPGVSFINHHDNRSNVRVQWSTTHGDHDFLMEEYSVTELYELGLGEDGYFVLDIVATRPISPGEELFLNYGEQWMTAWNRHVQEWEGMDAGYRSAAEYTQAHSEEVFRTVTEQITNPYPSNLQTACNYGHKQSGSSSTQIEHWVTNEEEDCWRPCDILERHKREHTGQTLYLSLIYPLENVWEPLFCNSIPTAGIRVDGIPSHAIQLVDKPYSKDEHLTTAFRHEIGIPSELYPRHWLIPDPEPNGDFMASLLPTGMVRPIRWADSAEVVTPWAFQVGLPQSVRVTLLQYCEKLGIVDIFRHVTVNGNALEANQNGYLKLDNRSWYLQRPGPDWRSNLHWLSPGDEASHQSYLEALGASGFNEVLQGIGEYLDLDGLVAFHMTFIAVSRSTEGYLHHDILYSGGKVYNVIIPLLLAKSTGPELDLVSGVSYDEDHDPDEYPSGRYRYEYDVAIMLGDGAVHATSAVDYRIQKEMRLAATVYIADVNELNVDSILKEYTQPYPPVDRDLLLRWAGAHWKKNDSSVRLPRPKKGHILSMNSTESP